MISGPCFGFMVPAMGSWSLLWVHGPCFGFMVPALGSWSLLWPHLTKTLHLLINTLMIESKYFEDRMYGRHQQQKTNSFEIFIFQAESIQCNT